MSEDIKPTTKDGKFIAHMSMAKQHLRVDEYIIVWPGNPIDGKAVRCEVATPKRKNGDFGKGKPSYYLNEPHSPMFDTIEQFWDNYKVKEIEKP